MDRAGAGRGPSRPAPAHAHDDLVELLVRNVTDYAIYALDPEGRVATWNEGARRVKGWEAEEVLGRHVSCFYPPEDIEEGKPDRELAIAVADGHYEDEGWRVRRDGTRFWANVVVTALRGEGGELLGFGKVTRDLTERKRGEDALRESEERFRLLVSSVADYAIFLLDDDGRIATWNLGAERLKGYRPDEIIGRPLATFYTEEDRRAGVPAAGLAHARTHGTWRSEGWRVRKDGTRFWASVVLTALRGADGRPRGFAKVTRDLTDRKRSEDALRGVLERERTAAAQIRELDRMRSDLVSTVAHDLRAPVGVVQALLHLLTADWDESTDDQKRELVDRMAERVHILGGLVDDVFDLVSIEAGHLEVLAEPFDLAGVASTVVSDCQAQRPDFNVELVAPTGSWALGDERRTWQVVSNLVSNAVKFSPAGAPIRVEVARSGDDVVLSVTDQGKGIAAEDQTAIFDRFLRLPAASDVPGSGLGLFIARSLAEAQGGSISLESAPGRGSTFRLVLPADADRSGVTA